MPSHVFPGYPTFLAQAASELGTPESAGPARRITVLTDLANLCAQASHGKPAHVEGILAKAAEFRDQLATALRAADLMLDAVSEGRRTSSLTEPEADPEFHPEVSLAPRPGRKGTKTERVS